MLTGGFVPQVATFVAVGNAEYQVPFGRRTINGVSRSFWDGSFIATPAWKEFMNTYLAQAKIPPDNNYGTPADKYMGKTQKKTTRNQGNTDGNNNSGTTEQNTDSTQQQ